MANRLVCTTVALLVVMSVATPSRTAAQDLGVLVGFNSANVDFDFAGVNVNVDPRSGFVGGLWFNQPLMDGFSVEIDGLVSMKGTAFNFDGDSGKIKLTYLDIPVLARVNLPGSGPVRIHVLGGPSFNFNLSESFEPGDDQDEDSVETFETAVVVGGGGHGQPAPHRRALRVWADEYRQRRGRRFHRQEQGVQHLAWHKFQIRTGGAVISYCKQSHRFRSCVEPVAPRAYRPSSGRLAVESPRLRLV